MYFPKLRLTNLWFLPLVLVMFCTGFSGPARAAAPAAPAVPTDLNGLVQTLQDPAQRQVLIGEIKTLIAVQNANHPAPVMQHEGPGGALVAFLSDGAMHIGAGVTALASLAPLTGIVNWSRQIAADPQLRMLWAKGAAMVFAILGAALLAKAAAHAALKRPVRRLRGAAGGSAWLRLLGVGGMILLGWVPVVVLLAAGYAALAVAQAQGDLPVAARALVLAVLSACALSRAIGAVAEACLASDARGRHFLPLSEANADYWLVWSRRLTRFVVYGWFALGFALDVGLNDAAYDVLLKAFGLLLTGLLVMLILQNRAAMARAIQGRNGRSTNGFGRLRAVLGDYWHVGAMLYLLGTYGVWAADVPGGFMFLIRASLLSLLIFAVARGADRLGTSLVSRFFTIAPELESRLPGLQKRVNLYAPLLIKMFRVLVYALAALLVLQAWGIDMLAAVESREGQRLVGGIVTIGVIAAIALAIWRR